MRVAFLGLGRMGAAMAAHVGATGHELVVWNRSPGRAGPLLAAGAREAAGPGEAVDGADAVVLMLFGPDSVREVLPQVLATAGQGVLLLNATTVGPDDARQFGQDCAVRGVRYVDCPVAGTVGPARDGTLGVLVGAAQQDRDDALSLLELWGDPAKVRWVGEVGAGSALKLCVNQSLGVTAAGLGETLRLGAELGVDRQVLLEVLAGTPYGWLLAQKRPMLESGDYSGTTFSLELMAKDLDLAVRAGRSAPAVTGAALDAARAALAQGHEGEDYAAMTGHLAGPAS